MQRYPSIMVPYVGLTTEVNVDNLVNDYDFAVARRIDRTLSDKDIVLMADGTGIVRLDSPLRGDFFERVPGLSMTMIRHSFPLSYAKYTLKTKPKEDDWLGGIVCPCKFWRKASIGEECYLMVYRASSLHGMPARYQTKFGSKDAALKVQDKYEGLKDDIIKNVFTKEKHYQSLGSISLKHSPTKLNYWHFELTLRNCEGDIISRAKFKKEQDPATMNMSSSFVNYVIDHFLFKLFWVNDNPCEKDVPELCFYDPDIRPMHRYLACLWNRIIFGLVPIVTG